MTVNRDRVAAIAHLYKGNPDVAYLINLINELAPDVPYDERPWCSYSSPRTDTTPELACALAEGHGGPHTCVVVCRP